MVLHIGRKSVILPLSRDSVWEDRENRDASVKEPVLRAGVLQGYDNYGLLCAMIANQGFTPRLLLHKGCE